MKKILIVLLIIVNIQLIFSQPTFFNYIWPCDHDNYITDATEKPNGDYLVLSYCGVAVHGAVITHFDIYGNWKGTSFAPGVHAYSFIYLPNGDKFFSGMGDYGYYHDFNSLYDKNNKLIWERIKGTDTLLTDKYNHGYLKYTNDSHFVGWLSKYREIYRMDYSGKMLWKKHISQYLDTNEYKTETFWFELVEKQKDKFADLEELKK